MLNKAKGQCALDLCCQPQDFDKWDNTLVFPQLLPGRRRFSAEKDFFRMAAFGRGAVICADGHLQQWCQEYLLGTEGIRLLEHDKLVIIEEQLRSYGWHLYGLSEFYLPYTDIPRSPRLDPEVKLCWYEKAEIPQLYDDKRFHNALLYDAEGLRPDVLAITASIDGQVAGMAGASEDSPMFWQIGIDVLPEYRNRGLAVYLVSALTDEILKRGAVPYYGTWSANIASRCVAAASGYFPAWVETNAVKNQNHEGEGA